MIDLSWKVFSQTGNIETYLLMKELETVYEEDVAPEVEGEKAELDTKM
ncbi:YqzL family protein [Aquibacillus sp. 3ASR75-11]|uniref:YqzL family protein n=1 Tax=Terrihalobacillus insolitus TaxID=2950438 RepID=A0A9X3WX62_9BACI|nr:YqzL family protein [Terrihalobacillus insolitus]MDC3413356.1 YqzL family protein [Terrihalobacillus insolitus]MDC3424939.1 YqzL family protein [Terrihalobacillus insolitus]